MDENFEALDHLLSILRDVEDPHPRPRVDLKFYSKHGDEEPTEHEGLFADQWQWELQECLRLARRYRALVDAFGDLAEKFKES